MKEVVLQDERVRIRPITMEDTDKIIEWRNSDEVRLNFVFQELFTKESHENWLKTQVFPGHAAQFIIEEVETGKAVGSCFLRDIDYKHEKAEYGHFLGAERGKGYGTAAGKLMLKYAFEILKLHKICGRVFADNEAAIRSDAKIGFEYEGLLRDDVKINGIYRDMIFVSIVNGRSEPEKRVDRVCLPIRATQ